MSRRTPRGAATAVGITVGLAATAVGALAFVARRAAALYPAPATEPAPMLERVAVTDAAGQDLPGWVTPAVGAGTRWAVALPGLGSHPLRHQDIAPALAEHGLTSLFAAHSARWPARRHGFGERETDEALAWLRFAAASGAREVVLFGWSFGALLWLRVLDRADPLPVAVRAVVLTGPLTDWVPTIAHGVSGGRLAHGVSGGRLGHGVSGGRLAHGVGWERLGRALGRGVTALLAVPGLARVAGQPAPLRIRPPAVARNTMPLLVVHSDADRTVPIATSRALVRAWSGPARLRVVAGARHGGERDGDPNGWLDDVSTTV